MLAFTGDSTWRPRGAAETVAVEGPDAIDPDDWTCPVNSGHWEVETKRAAPSDRPLQIHDSASYLATGFTSAMRALGPTISASLAVGLGSFGVAATEP